VIEAVERLVGDAGIPSFDSLGLGGLATLEVTRESAERTEKGGRSRVS